MGPSVSRTERGALWCGVRCCAAVQAADGHGHGHGHGRVCVVWFAGAGGVRARVCVYPGEVGGGQDGGPLTQRTRHRARWPMQMSSPSDQPDQALVPACDELFEEAWTLRTVCKLPERSARMSSVTGPPGYASEAFRDLPRALKAIAWQGGTDDASKERAKESWRAKWKVEFPAAANAGLSLAVTPTACLSVADSSTACW